MNLFSFSYLLNSRFGRKPTLLVIVIPLIAGWILIGIASGIKMLFVSRTLSGISYGMAYSAAPMYLGEIASDSIRGSIGTLLTVMAKLGILIQYSIAPYISIKLNAWLALITPALFVMVFIFLPESPYYLLMKDKNDEALASLRWLRGNNDNVVDELSKMRIAVRQAQENRGTLKELFSRGNIRSLIIVLGIGASQQLCGSQAIIAYSQQIFEKVGSSIRSSELSIIMGIIQLFSAAVASSIVDRLGRRPLLLISAIGTTICNTLVGVYFLLDYKEVDVSSISWIPLISIMIFIICYTIGLATVPYAILSEVFPTNVKSLAIAVCTMSTSAIAFGVTKLYQRVSDDLGVYVAFLGFAFFTFFFILFIFFLVPETKGKSLATIIVDMHNGPFKRKKITEIKIKNER